LPEESDRLLTTDRLAAAMFPFGSEEIRFDLGPRAKRVLGLHLHADLGPVRQIDVAYHDLPASDLRRVVAHHASRVAE